MLFRFLLLCEQGRSCAVSVDVDSVEMRRGYVCVCWMQLAQMQVVQDKGEYT